MRTEVTYRHLDDPVSIYGSLNIMQLGTILLSLGAGAGSAWLLLRLGLRGHAVAIPAANLAVWPGVLGVLLFAGRHEPLARQGLGYLTRQVRGTLARARGQVSLWHGAQAGDTKEHARETAAEGRHTRALEVRGITFAGRSDDDQDQLCTAFASLLAGLPAGVRLSVVVDNGAARATDALRRLLPLDRGATEDLRAAGRSLTADLRHTLRTHYVADTAITLRLSAKEQATVEHALEMVQAALEHLEITCTPGGTVAGIPAVARELPEAVCFPDGTHACSFSLLRLPDGTRAGLLHPLLTLPYRSRVTLTYDLLEPERERRRLTGRVGRMHVAQADRARGGYHADVLQGEAIGEAVTVALRLQDPAVRLLRFGLGITVYGPSRDEAAARARDAVGVARSLSCVVTTGRGAQVPLLRGQVRGYRVTAQTAATSFPFLCKSAGAARGHVLGMAGRELVLLDLGDPELATGLMVVAGKSGSGKSAAIQKIALSSLCAGGKVTVLARVSDYDDLCRLAGGALLRTADDYAGLEKHTLAPMVVCDLAALTPEETAALLPRVTALAAARSRAGTQDTTIVDEGWHLLRYIDGGSEAIELLSLAGRRAGRKVIFSTQQISKLLDDPVAVSLFDQASLALLFRQSDYKAEAGLAQLLHLSTEEAALVSGLRTVRWRPGRPGYADALLLRTMQGESRATRGVVRIQLTELERRLFGSYPDEREAREKAIAQAGGNVYAALTRQQAGPAPKKRSA